jgi:quaternary ammonium compound-resistance protein SugE
MYLLLTLGAALAFSVGGVFMKYAQGMTKLWPSLAMFLLFAVGAACQTFALRKANLGVAYLFVLGLEAVLAFVFGVLFFQEDRSLVKLLGVAAIVVGIVLLHTGET